MSAYACATFCLLALCASLVLHDSCVSSGTLLPSGCDGLRRSGTLVVLAVAALVLARVHELDEWLSLVLVLMLASGLLLASPSVKTA